MGAVADRLFRVHLGPGWRAAPSERVAERVAGVRILITGASSGIGAATARLLGAAGADLVLLARRRDRLEQVAAEVERRGGRARVQVTDLTDEHQVTRALDRLVTEDLQVVVHSAGKSIRRSLAGSADRFHDVRRTNAANYLGPIQLISGLLPGIRAAGAGHVINVSSVSATLPVPMWSLYSGSKSGFEGWLRAVAPEVAADGVRTSSIHFPLVHTDMSAANYAHWPGLTAEAAAEVVAGCLVRRPRLLDPWWARLTAPVLANAPTVTDRVLGRALR